MGMRLRVALLAAVGLLAAAPAFGQSHTVASRTQPPPQSDQAVQMVAMWCNRIAHHPDPARDGMMTPMLSGQVFLHKANGQVATPEGPLTVELFDDTPRPGRTESTKLGQWTFDKDKLRRLKIDDERFGPCYAVFLPWSDYRAEITRVRLKAKYEPEGGFTINTPSSTITLEATPPTAQTDAPKKKQQLVTKVFEVSELVVPIPDFGPAPMNGLEKWKSPTMQDNAEKLVRQVTTLVRPYTWDTAGGEGSVHFYEIGFALVVNNTPEIVAEVGDLLSALKRMQDVTIACEVRVIRGPVGFRDRIGLKPVGDATLILNDRELQTVMEAVQSNRRCEMQQAPKVVTADGQLATVRNGEQRHFVTSLETSAAPNGDVFVIPKSRTVELGDVLTVCGRVSNDEKAVTLRVNLTRTWLIGEVEMIPVTTHVTPVFEGGAKGQPVPFTQFLQVPQLQTVTAERTASVPTGSTVVVGGWVEPAGERTVIERKMPFTGKRTRSETPSGPYEVVVLATVRVVRATE